MCPCNCSQDLSLKIRKRKIISEINILSSFFLTFCSALFYIFVDESAEAVAVLAKAAADKHAFFPTVISVLATVAAANVSSKEGTYDLSI